MRALALMGRFQIESWPLIALDFHLRRRIAMFRHLQGTESINALCGLAGDPHDALAALLRERRWLATTR